MSEKLNWYFQIYQKGKLSDLITYRQYTRDGDVYFWSAKMIYESIPFRAGRCSTKKEAKNKLCQKVLNHIHKVNDSAKLKVLDSVNFLVLIDEENLPLIAEMIYEMYVISSNFQLVCFNSLNRLDRNEIDDEFVEQHTVQSNRRDASDFAIAMYLTQHHFKSTHSESRGITTKYIIASKDGFAHTVMDICQSEYKIDVQCASSLGGVNDILKPYT